MLSANTAALSVSSAACRGGDVCGHIVILAPEFRAKRCYGSLFWNGGPDAAVGAPLPAVGASFGSHEDGKAKTADQSRR